jgi:peptidoglycan/xylan/chitin deacetylase (PgdA/CDA1 family)
MRPEATRMPTVMPHGVMFHHFHDDRHPHAQGSIDATELADLIAWLRLSCDILPAADWRARALAGSLGERDVCLTFDDSLLCQYDVAGPVLRDLGLTAFWFVYTSPLVGKAEMLEVHRYFRNVAFDGIDDFYDGFFACLATGEWADDVAAGMTDFDPASYLAEFSFYTERDRAFRFARDRVLGPDRYAAAIDAMMEAAGFDIDAAARYLWMTPDHLRQLIDDGHVVGLHSHTHPTDMAGLPESRQAREYAENLEVLRRLTGGRIDTMAHPCNSYNADTLGVLDALGVSLGFRANPAQAVHGPLEFPRQDHTILMSEMRAAGARATVG